MHVLCLHSEDQPGIVAAVATSLSNAQCNIEESSQFFDPFSARFFMRVVFRPLSDDSLQSFLRNFPLHATRFGMVWTVHDLRRPVRTLIFVSKTDHCLRDLLYKAEIGALNIDVAGIVSNHEDLAPLAANAGIPYFHCPMSGGKDAQENALEDLIGDTGAELILLARYMQILSDGFSAAYAGRIINIHHSFLPGFKGAKPYHQAYERGVKLIGATAHFVTGDLDEGPIIAQDVEPVDHAQSPASLQAIGRDIEARVLARAARLYTERRIFAHGPRTVIL